jgi:hypothetical protein
MALCYVGHQAAHSPAGRENIPAVAWQIAGRRRAAAGTHAEFRALWQL